MLALLLGMLMQTWGAVSATAVAGSPLGKGSLWHPSAPPALPRAEPTYRVPELTTIEIGGRRYDVTVIAMETVSITGGDPAAPKNAAFEKYFTTAATRVTGCAVHSYFWQERTFIGTLDCSARVLR